MSTIGTNSASRSTTRPSLITAMFLPQPLRGVPLVATWFAQIAAAGILGQTLFFKFTGAPEAKFIFTTLGVEPWGRLGLGVVELLCAVILLIPRTAVYGALLAVGLMVGAIGSHLTKLGIEVQGDGGLLFGLAITTFVLSLVVIALRRAQLLGVIATLRA